MTWLWKHKLSYSEVSCRSQVCQNPPLFIWLPLLSSLSWAAFSATSPCTALRPQLMTVNFLAHNCTAAHHKTAVSMGALASRNFLLSNFRYITLFQSEEKLAGKYLFSQHISLLKLRSLLSFISIWTVLCWKIKLLIQLKGTIVF